MQAVMPLKKKKKNNKEEKEEELQQKFKGLFYIMDCCVKTLYFSKRVPAFQRNKEYAASNFCPQDWRVFLQSVGTNLPDCMVS